MTGISIGDLAQSFVMRHRNADLQQDITRLSQELITGQVADVREVLPGNYSYLASMERRSALLAQYGSVTAEATQFASATQAALGQIEEIGSNFSLRLISITNGTAGQTEDVAAEARLNLGALVSAFNASSGGRNLFSGAATDRAAVVGREELLAQVTAAVSGNTTPDSIIAAAKAWFDDPAGFAATAYTGAATGMAGFAVSETENITLDLRATTPELRNMLRLTALSAIADDPALGLDTVAQTELLAKTGTEMLQTRQDLVSLQGQVGYAEARLEQISTRTASEATSLEMARGALLNVDPYEAATRLEEAQFQLQSLYSVTVRMSQLSLVNFL